jgi:Xaa-Pro aminopeptidase
LIEERGLGAYYTHRLGHGLGLETHEHPYLNGANDELLKIGQVVSNEPVCDLFLFLPRHPRYLSRVLTSSRVSMSQTRKRRVWDTAGDSG